jgi:His-Xaa-Ser system protein HxsD
MKQQNGEVGTTAAMSPGTSVEFDTTVYRLNAVKKAAYRFGDRFHAKIEMVGPSRVRVELIPKTGTVDLPAQVREFCNEVLDQELRETVAKETETVRNLLLAQAFSATSLIDAVGDEGSYKDDPKNITRAKPSIGTDSECL